MAHEARGLRVVFSVLVLCIYGCKQGHDVQPEAKVQPTLVRLEDIGNGVEIIGVLDHPLCSFLTIRGTWIQHPIAKDDSLLFRVDLVNGKKPNSKIELHAAKVIPIYSSCRKVGGIVPADGSSDWKFAMGGREPAPTPKEGDAYELVGVETCYFDSYPEELFQELGSVAPQSESFRTGLVLTRFEFVATRKIIDNSATMRRRTSLMQVGQRRDTARTGHVGSFSEVFDSE